MLSFIHFLTAQMFKCLLCLREVPALPTDGTLHSHLITTVGRGLQGNAGLSSKGPDCQRRGGDAEAELRRMIKNELEEGAAGVSSRGQGLRIVLGC